MALIISPTLRLHQNLAQKVARKYNIPIDRSLSSPILRGRAQILSLSWTAARAQIESAAALLK